MAPTTEHQIRNWFGAGTDQGAAYMIVWCDSFNYEDYPVYYADAAAATAAARKSGQNMQRAMECYDLNAPRELQLRQLRCWALNPPQ